MQLGVVGWLVGVVGVTVGVVVGWCRLVGNQTVLCVQMANVEMCAAGKLNTPAACDQPHPSSSAVGAGGWHVGGVHVRWLGPCSC